MGGRKEHIIRLQYVSVAMFAIFICAIAVQGFRLRFDQTLVEPLAQILPDKAEGWTVDDLPLGETEMQSELTAKILRFDEYVIRRYRRAPTTEFIVYIARWARGKVPASAGAGHTPDICWVNSGWHSETSRSEVWLAANLPTAVRGEWRRMRAPEGGTVVEVWFCHAGGRRFFTLAESQSRGLNFVRRVKEIWAELWTGSVEQHFVRISSREPLAKLSEDPFFREVVARINDRILVHAANAKDGLSAR